MCTTPTPFWGLSDFRSLSIVSGTCFTHPKELMNSSLKPIAVATASIFFLNSCATIQEDLNEIGANYGTAIGCGAGAIIGGVIGAQFDGGRGTVIGAAIGTAVGCYAGHKWQKRMIALQELSASTRQVIDVETVVKVADDQPAQAGDEADPKLEQVGFVAQLNNVEMFAINESRLTPGGQILVGKLAQTLIDTPAEGQGNLTNRRFLIVGHTDNTGTAELNQTLSERRAKEVGKVLLSKGVAANNIFYQGAGASRPLVDNSTASGQVRNRRVEIVELNDEEALVLRIAQESSAIRYAKYSTKPNALGTLHQTQAIPTTKEKIPQRKVDIAKVTIPPTEPTTASSALPDSAADTAAAANARIDFRGRLVNATGKPNIAENFQPKRENFALIREARANTLNVTSCLDDSPRVSGQVKSLANDKPYKAKASTLDYVPGFNATVWANTVNGHLVWLYPVAVLQDGYVINQQPVLEVVDNYKAGNRKPISKVLSYANVFEGENEFLYRTYFDKNNDGDLVCMDLVFDRKEVKTTKGYLYYTDGAKQVRYASYLPTRQN